MSDNDPGAGNLCRFVFSVHGNTLFTAGVEISSRCTYD